MHSKLQTKVEKALNQCVSDKGRPVSMFSTKLNEAHPLICAESFRENISHFTKEPGSLKDKNEVFELLVKTSQAETELKDKIMKRLKGSVVEKMMKADKDTADVVERVRSALRTIAEDISALIMSWEREMVDIVFESENVYTISEISRDTSASLPLENDLDAIDIMGKATPEEISRVLKPHVNGAIQNKLEKMLNRLAAMEKNTETRESSPTQRLDKLLFDFQSSFKNHSSNIESGMKIFFGSRKKNLEMPPRQNCSVENGIAFCKGRKGGCNASGTIWGSNPYTSDSPNCLCAVHAGLITREDGGFYRIGPQSNLPSYTGSTANGVSTQAYGPFNGATFSVV